jgi:hypothetical protein
MDRCVNKVYFDDRMDSRNVFIKWNFLNKPQLFNGDFVDRGSFSVECIFTLFGFKLLYPEHFFMSRGNVPVISELW